MIDPEHRQDLGPDLRRQGGHRAPSTASPTGAKPLATVGRRRGRRGRRERRHPRGLRRDRQGRHHPEGRHGVRQAGHRDHQAQGRQGRGHHRGRHPVGRLQRRRRQAVHAGQRQGRRRRHHAHRGPARVCRVAAAGPGRRLRGPAGLDDACGSSAWVARAAPVASRSPSATTRRRRCRRARCARGACIHAAWASVVNNYYGKDCGSEQPSPAVSIVRADQGGGASRVSRCAPTTGWSCSTTWTAVRSGTSTASRRSSTSGTPSSRRRAPDKDTKKKDENLIDETSVAQPPKAKPDNLKARPGRTSKLHVLDNDTDAAGLGPGDRPGRPRPGRHGRRHRQRGGRRPEHRRRRSPTTPSASRSRSPTRSTTARPPQKSQAKVTVTLVPDEVNTPPILRPGTATLARTVYPVNKGKLLPGAGHRRLARPRERLAQPRGDWPTVRRSTASAASTCWRR